MTTVVDICELVRIETSVATGTASVRCHCGAELALAGHTGDAVDEAFLVRNIMAVWDVHTMVRWGRIDPAELATGRVSRVADQ